MATIDDPRSETANTTPESTGVRTTTPQSVFSSEYSFLLQMVMELQRSTGQLTEAANSVKIAIEKQSLKIEQFEGKLSAVTHKIYAAGAVLAVLVVLGGWIVNRAWDLAINKLLPRMEMIVPIQPAAPVTPAPGKKKP